MAPSTVLPQGSLVLRLWFLTALAGPLCHASGSKATPHHPQVLAPGSPGVGVNDDANKAYLLTGHRLNLVQESLAQESLAEEQQQKASTLRASATRGGGAGKKLGPTATASERSHEAKDFMMVIAGICITVPLFFLLLSFAMGHDTKVDADPMGFAPGSGENPDALSFGLFEVAQGSCITSMVIWSVLGAIGIFVLLAFYAPSIPNIFPRVGVGSTYMRTKIGVFF